MSFDRVKHVERVQKPKLQAAFPFILYERHDSVTREFPRPSLCLSVYLSVYLYIYLSLCLSICCSSICLSIYLVYPSLCLSIYLPVYVYLSAVNPSVYLVYLSVYLPVYLLFIHLSVCVFTWSIYLSICLSIYTYLSACLCLSVCCQSVRLFAVHPTVYLPAYVYLSAIHLSVHPLNYLTAKAVSAATITQ